MCYKFTKSQEKIHHIMNRGEIKQFVKYEKEPGTLIHVIRIRSKDIEIEFCIEKCAKSIMRSEQKKGNRELLCQKRIRTFGEKENYKYLGIFEMEPIKQVKMRENMKIKAP